MYVIGGDHVVEDTEAISLLCLEQPSKPVPPVPGKLEKKFSFVTTMGDMPDMITWKVMPICARHF